MYIYQRADWPRWSWDDRLLTPQISRVRHLQGQLLGRARWAGFPVQLEAQLEILALDILTSNAIEGNHLNTEEVRSSIAKRLGVDFPHARPTSRYIDGVVEMMLDATEGFDQPITAERLFGWHGALFPTGRSGLHQIAVGAWRADLDGPMQVVSGGMGRERLHFEAPPATAVEGEMARLVSWLNTSELEPLIKSGVAHLWFLTIHPFEDGNGRVARALSDLLLTRSDRVPFRFYSVSAQIERKKSEYYQHLEMAQRGTLDITSWLTWYLSCLEGALVHSAQALERVFARALFWEAHRETPLNERQRQMLKLLLGDFVGKLKTSKWAKLCKCSHDTAARDINDLIARGVLEREEAGGRSTSYRLVAPPSPVLLLTP
ncbi:MAG: Fic family protein [Deltaproteobacteria bacterium]|nr:Fic family protein [Deltaproteobacteria bacterium]